MRAGKQSPGFGRSLGRSPLLRSVRAQLVEPAMLEAFGPGERMVHAKSPTLVYWNFIREDGRNGFTIFARICPKAKPGKLTVNLAAERGARSFYEWVLDRVGAVENGDAEPKFVGSGAFAIQRVGS